MDYKELMAKIKRGEALTQEEIADFDREFRPTYRFNEVSQKKSELESQIKTMTEENEKLKIAATEAEQRVQDQVNAQLSELSGKVETLTAENNELRTKASETSNLLKFTTLATKNELGVIFKNPDYLVWKAQKEGVDVNDPEKLKGFLSEVKEKEPELCLVPVNGGSGSGNQPPAHAEVKTPVSQWDVATKVKYIKENGNDAYLNLVRNEQGESPEQ